MVERETHDTGTEWVTPDAKGIGHLVPEIGSRAPLCGRVLEGKPYRGTVTGWCDECFVAAWRIRHVLAEAFRNG